MIVAIKIAALKGIKPHEWAVRFFFGGIVCVVAGLIADKFGPGIGGLFLAFPAIFPAGASLVEEHEKKHKERAGFDGTNRGRTMAGIDAAGAALGCIGLAGFAAVCWQGLPRLNVYAVFLMAVGVWLVLNAVAWLLAKSRIFRSRHRRERALRVFKSS